MVADGEDDSISAGGLYRFYGFVDPRRADRFAGQHRRSFRHERWSRSFYRGHNSVRKSSVSKKLDYCSL